VNSITIKITIIYYNESGILFKKLNYEIGTAYNIGNKECYAETGDEKSNESINSH
jgi:hypothetical protein